MAGLVVVAGMIAANPPTSSIPEPSLSYMHSDYVNLFRYVNDTQGGVTTNPLWFHLSFSTLHDNMAILRLSSVRIIIWIADITSDQPNLTLILVDPATRVTSKAISYDAGIVERNETDGKWWSTGECFVHIENDMLIGDVGVTVEYVFMIVNGYAKDYDGHEFLVKIQVIHIYNAYWLGGLISTLYRNTTFEYELGSGTPAFMRPYDE